MPGQEGGGQGTTDAHLAEYCQAREDLRHKYNNYRYIILAMITGAAAIGSILGQDGLKKVAWIVPGFLVIWLIFLGYNYHRVSELKRFIEQLKEGLDGIPDLKKKNKLGGAYPIGMGFVLVIVIVGMFGGLIYYGGWSLSDQGGWAIVLYALVLLLIIAGLGTCIIADFCIWPFTEIRGSCQENKEAGTQSSEDGSAPRSE